MFGLGFISCLGLLQTGSPPSAVLQRSSEGRERYDITAGHWQRSGLRIHCKFLYGEEYFIAQKILHHISSAALQIIFFVVVELLVKFHILVCKCLYKARMCSC